MSNIDKIRREIKRRVKFHDDAMKACASLNNIALIHSAGLKEDEELIAFIDSLQQEQSETDLDTDIETKKESESDENERIRQALDEIFKRYLNLVVSSEEECRHSWRELVDVMQLGINAMKEGQKSAESNYSNVNSEYDKGYKEDEKIIESICRSINEESIAEGLKCHGKSYSINELSELRIKMINFLKSINQKLKQEWSEGDEEMMADIIDSLEYAYPYDNEFRIAWLKSLRPQPKWKPSEEQMEALERASTNKYLSAKQFDILVSLYEHLKTLI